MEFVETRLRAAFRGRSRNALTGTLQTALGGPGARPRVLPRGHVVGDAAVSRGADHEVGTRRSGETARFLRLALGHLPRAAGVRVGALRYAAGTIGLVDVPIVLDNRHHESHFRRFSVVGGGGNKNSALAR